MGRTRAHLAIAMALIITVGLGAILRAWLGGSGWLPGDFRHLRHAHTHLGWYGAVFPLAFGVWRSRGWWTPGPRLMVVYWLAVITAALGFLRAGYGVEAIVGSTVVLGVWLLIQFRNRAQLHWRRADWLAAVPLLVLLAAMSIPPLAMYVRRDPALSTRWVQTFLTLLLFGGGLPAALARAQFRPPPGGLWAVAVVSTSLWVGVLPKPWLVPGSFLLGGLLCASAIVSNTARFALRINVFALGFGFIAVAFELLSFNPQLAVAGVHLAVLGPVLHGLHGDPKRTTPLSLLLLTLLGVMCLGILMPTLPRAVWPVGLDGVLPRSDGVKIAAISGVALAVGTAIWALLPSERGDPA